MRQEIEQRIERHRYIIERLKEGDAVRVEDLASKFGCSPSTIQSDLRHLRYLGIELATRRGVIQAKESRRASLIREISFPPEYKEAGISILSYFSRVLEHKYPNIDAAVTITQQGTKVTLKVESGEGELEIIEKALTEYGKVVSGEMAPKDFVQAPFAILELNNRLEIARLELRLKEQAHLAMSSQQNERIISLEGQLKELRAIVGTQLEVFSDLTGMLRHLSSSADLSNSVAKAMDTLQKVILSGHTEDNERLLASSLRTIRDEDPGLFQQIRASISAVGHSIAANLATPWVVSILSSLPK